MKPFLRIHAEADRILGADPRVIPAFMVQCVEEHHKQLLSSTATVLKNSPESAVTLVDIPGFPRVCVKQFRWRGRLHACKGLLRPTQGLRTFRNGWRLLAAGIAVPAPLALIRERHMGCVANEYIVMEVIPGLREMDRYLLSRILEPWTIGEKRAMAAVFGRFIGAMHAEGIFHGDLKTCNIMVSERPEYRDGAPQTNEQERQTRKTCGITIRFALLDYDEVCFAYAVSRKKRIKNLCQIFLSTPVAIGATDRMRFFREYALHVGLNAAQRREIARAVLEAARGREVLYVGFDGDCRERWDDDTGYKDSVIFHKDA